MDIFVSYSSDDVDAVRRLIEDVELGGHQVWFDHDLYGGEDWWGRIVERIRTCSVVVFALAQSSLRSQACRAELDYARALRVPVIPVQVGRVESLFATPISEYQVIDYQDRVPSVGVRLMSAITQSAARREPLPEPLPPAPPAPFAYLFAVARQVSEPSLRSAEQAAAIGQLRHALRDEQDDRARADARRLLLELRRHPECTFANAQEIDTILKSLGAAPTANTGSASQTPAQKPRQVSYDLDLSGTWWAAWQTWKDGQPRVDTHELEIHQRGEVLQLTADRATSVDEGSYRWQGELRLWDNEALVGWYRSTDAAVRSKGALYLSLHPHGNLAWGRWVGMSYDGVVVTGWGAIARTPELAEKTVQQHISQDAS